MAAIAGIAVSDGTEIVNQMLNQIAYRGSQGCQIKSYQGITLGVRWPTGQPEAERALLEDHRAEDAISDSHFASAQVKDHTLTLTRDPLGVAPLYYGYTAEKVLCFASEVKALKDFVDEVHEVPPGCSVVNGAIQPYYQVSPQPVLTEESLEIAAGLRRRLITAVEKRANRGITFGSWLSGGLDSSILTAAAQKFSGGRILTFSVGFPESSDIQHARIVARYLRSVHHEMIPDFREIVKALPEVIYHLESFDLFLVRSSLMNYLVAKLAADYVPAIFSGEGSDELFGGYHYMRKISPDDLPGEIIQLTSQLHNTALQRVDRCSAAFGTVAYVPYLDRDIVDYALRIPPEYKINNGFQKWILRQAFYDLLPQSVLNREKERFWEGAGVQNRMAKVAGENVTDKEYDRLLSTPYGATLRSKEEAYYYLLFQEQFGEQGNLSWMGRMKDEATLTPLSYSPPG